VFSNEIVTAGTGVAGILQAPRTEGEAATEPGEENEEPRDEH